MKLYYLFKYCEECTTYLSIYIQNQIIISIVIKSQLLIIFSSLRLTISKMHSDKKKRKKKTTLIINDDN